MRRALTYDTDRKFGRPSPATVHDLHFAQYDHIYVNESEYAGNRDEELESFIKSKSFDANVLPSTTAITEHQLSLLCPITFAFAISSKQWSKLAIFY